MEQHICTVCGYAASIHPEECECGELHWPPLCCPSCDCESFEEAHQDDKEWFDWDCPNCGETHNDPEFIETHCRKCGLIVTVYNWGAQSHNRYVEIKSESWDG